MNIKEVKNDFVIFKLIEDEVKEESTEKNGIYLGENPQTFNLNSKEYSKGEVIAVGSGAYYSGIFVDQIVKVGDIIVFSNYSSRLKLDSEFDENKKEINKTFSIKPSEIIVIL